MRKLMSMVLSLIILVSLVLTACSSATPAPASSGAPASGAPAASKPTTVKLGLIMPMTGDIAAYGIGTANAVKLAISELNAESATTGITYEVIVEDDENKPEKTIDAFNKLTSKDDVDVIVGALASKCSLAIAPLAQQTGIPMITTSSTNENVTLAGDFVFGACFIDPFQGTVVAKFAADSLKKKTAAIVFDNGNDYSKGLATQFEKSFVEYGGTVVAKEAYSINDKDFSAILAKIKENNPEVIFIPDYYSTVALIAKQVRDQGMTDAILLGGDGWDEIVNNAGAEVAGSFYSNHYAPESDDADVQDFVKKYQAAYNETPNALAALGYDAVKIVAKAVQAAGSSEPAAIRDAMAKVEGKFVTGNIKFNENRNPVKSAVMIKVEKADSGLAARYYETVNP